MDTLESLTKVIVGISTLLVALKNLIEILGNFPLRVGLAKFALNIITVVVPVTAIIWYFYYLAGLYSNRLSEPTFFLAMVIQAALAVSVYWYIWVVWISPKLRSMFAPAKKKQIQVQESSTNNHRKKESPLKQTSNKDAQGGKK
jgi:hypothetical protein